MAEDLTVLIGNLGRLDNLRPCLRSLLGTSSDTSAIRVIIGFNFEGDDDAPQALAREFPQVEQLRAPGNLGYCRAYNQMMARCTSRYVLLLDDDTILAPNTIAGMIAFMDAHPEIGIAGCRTTNPDGSYQKTTARMFDLKTEMVNIFRPAAFWNDGIDETITTWQPVGWLNGHFLMVRNEVIQKVGGLDEFYYTFQCEADWCLRIQRAGWLAAYVPDVEIMHIGGQHSVASKVKSRDNLLRSHINRYYFVRKQYGAAAAHAFRPIMSAGAMMRLLRYAAMWIAKPASRPESGPKVEAYWRIMLLGAAIHPEVLPGSLQRRYSKFSLQEARP